MSDTTSISQGHALADALDRVAPALVFIQVDLDGRPRLATGLVWSAAEGLIATTSRLFRGPPPTRLGEPDAEDPVIRVRGADGKVRRGTLVGRDDATELALLKVDDPAGLAEAELARDGSLRVGTFVAPAARTDEGLRVALGLVKGLGPAWVTAGGGAVEQRIDVEGELPPGFAGGPLIDFDGRVHGLNVRGLLQGGTTLPLATVRRVVDVLGRGATTASGHLGVGIREIELPAHALHGVTPPLALARGLLVTGIGQDTGAARAGLELGDVIIRIDDRDTPDHAHLLAALSGKAGVPVSVLFLRHGRAEVRQATPGERTSRGESPRGTSQGDTRHARSCGSQARWGHGPGAFWAQVARHWGVR